MIGVVVGLNYGLSAWALAVVMITGVTLLQTSYIIIMILCSEQKQIDLSVPRPINTQTWTPMRRGYD